MAAEGQQATEETGGAPAMAVATVAAPTYLEGRLHRLSQTLTGLLRVYIGGGTVGLDQTANGVVASGRQWETVAASATDQALGATGAIGDDLDGLLIVPATTSPGAVSIKDGAGSAITVFTGGASSVSNLVPFFVPLGMRSLAGAWKVTTGTNVSCIGVGKFAA